MAQPLSEAEQLALLDRLADGGWHSGETLAAAFGISRAALAKRIDRLADWQLVVESRQGLGYRLSAPLERLDVETLRAAVKGLRVNVVAVTDSTNTRLLDAAADHDPQALLAEFQRAGRGRRGRQWVSPFGANLYLSVAWSFAAWPPQLTALPLAVGVACARALRSLGLERLRLKWPNDLIVDGRKLGGILLEHRGEGGGGCRIVAGVGLNVRMDGAQAAAVDQAWINLDEALGTPVSRNALAGALLRELEAVLRAYALQGFVPLADDWRALDLVHERPVRVLMGERVLEGIARGVDAQGALIVDAAGERHHLSGGEVSLRVA
ncbi:MAG TPA: bifunctional biotin--[acetyl-CoA-carboxylase] ligase/biotin operon repressor BirA [Solimonas sp.]